MGIKNLTKLIQENAPGAMKDQKLDNFFGRKVAIDASMTIYQFMIAVRSGGELLTNENGEVTSHLQGLLARTIRFLEMGIKPIYVFDGKPPKAKAGELEIRRAKASEAQEELKKATESGNQEDIEKFSKRTVRVSKEQNADCKKLLRLMGMPVVEAPCEAEAQCAELCKGGKVYATATEDMDALTFGTPILARHFTMSEARKLPVLQFSLSTVLNELELNQSEFMDLCILLGCDYCNSIKGVGQVKAMEMIKKYRTIEEVIKHLDPSKYPIPANYMEEVAAARHEFLEAEVTKAEDVEIKWGECDPDGLTQFLVGEKQFNEERVKNSIAKLEKMKKTSTQVRMDSFFKPKDPPPGFEKKRKLDPKAKGKGAKMAKVGGAGAKVSAKASSWGKKKK